ncbi:RluA family pseudouridine synthase [Patescibacteria group bacterium]|nr:RluA family pseudouridine synthase [Patescibacteria group bacterium]MBU2579567.1 RluA family pseudouridine synthase [Patescibacteria group bacterium]
MSITLKIIYENDDFLVLEKPADLTVHPVKPEQKNTLADLIVARYPEIKGVGEDPLRPGIVHRLDKDTSGLMVVAKNNQSFNYLKKQFQDRKVEKEYLALVVGKIKDKKGTITKSISQSKKDHKKRSALLGEKSKPAWTEYEVLEYYKQYTLVKAMPKTGRTHQIRIHLASIGYPIAGDKQYKFKRQPCPKNLSRQFLHSYYLKFQTTDGKMIAFKSELPQDLKEVLKDLEKIYE